MFIKITAGQKYLHIIVLFTFIHYITAIYQITSSKATEVDKQADC